ncbi:MULTISPECIES: STAS domain-containing protein [unclassified Streptomyces]|uniref:STAS domain-containing protein n=1 Tax=unclassified Streptomyces TaxID=2593676 RepID=UPI003327ECE2
MTALPHPSFTLTAEAGPGTAHLHLVGELDYETSDELLQHTDRCLAGQPDLTDLHLDCTELRFCDSMGLSTLLTIHRKTTARHIRLHLDNPPPFLERILNTTGVRQLFPQTYASRRTEQALADGRTPPHTL